MGAAYDVLVGLHVGCAIVGFGSVAISGAYGAGARRPVGTEAVEETARYFRGQGRSELLVLGVPAFGAAAIAVGNGEAGFTELWVVAGLALWLAAAALLLAVVRPAEAQIRRSVPDGMAPAATRLMWAAAACDVLFVAALAFMVAQPS